MENPRDHDNIAGIRGICFGLPVAAILWICIFAIIFVVMEFIDPGMH